ncbi:hypothetical protein ABZ916_23630 [Streptomyces sp. NPDC046853]|uniref:hypothetical protein n=1 Tax=Streptomyces sp. NPDC046853 TaxID=3154920 RepID=UPI003401DAC3
MLSMLKEPAVVSAVLGIILEVVRLLHSGRSMPSPQPVVIVVDQERCNRGEKK